MRILITGGGGYLGCVLVRHLLQTTRHSLVILDRFDWGVQPLVSAIGAQKDRVVVHRADVRDPSNLWEALIGCVDAIIHLAAIVGYPACDAAPQDADTTNVEGTGRCCLYSDRIGGCPVIFASTGSTYGKVSGLATEETPISPLTRYGRTKALAERIVLDHGGVALRLATLYGLSPRMRWDLLVHDFCRRAVEDGELRVYEPHARRTFLHVEDAADAFAHAVEGRLAPGVWNIGHASGNLTKSQLAELVSLETGCRVTEIEGADPDQRDYAVSYQKVYPYWQPDEARGLGKTVPGLVQVARVWEAR